MTATRCWRRLEHGGVLTTPLDEHGAWHRYHPLFAELLRAELSAQLPGEVPSCTGGRRPGSRRTATTRPRYAMQPPGAPGTSPPT